MMPTRKPLSGPHKRTDGCQTITVCFLLDMTGVINVGDASTKVCIIELSKIKWLPLVRLVVYLFIYLCCRKRVVQVLRELLLSDSVTHTIVSSVLASYTQLHVDTDAFIASVAEIISDIREPITVQQQEMGREERRQLDLKVGWSILYRVFCVFV